MRRCCLAANSTTRRRQVRSSSTIPTNRRRTVYARISRLKLNDLLMQFDYPDANVHAEQRAVTTTPMQKLFVLNSPFMHAPRRGPREHAAADRAESDDRRASRWPIGCSSPRDPTPGEIELGIRVPQQGRRLRTCRAGSSTPRSSWPRTKCFMSIEPASRSIRPLAASTPPRRCSAACAPASACSACRPARPARRLRQRRGSATARISPPGQSGSSSCS